MICLDPTLVTDRLTLTRPTGQDAPDHAAMRLANDGWPVERSWRSLATLIGHWSMRGHGFYVVRAGDRFAGMVGPWMPPGWPELEIGWHLSPSERGKGFATEAARTILAHIAERLGRTGLVSYIDADNAPSQAVATRLGAVHAGETTLEMGDSQPHPAQIWRHPSGAVPA